uniref:Uncharacterized protein n=1 Tax=Neolamprologus brichardi TaxID=32507 RepID=A0A3Q4GGP2_NEOBR
MAPPLREPGSAGGFFLLKGSFSFPLVAKKGYQSTDTAVSSVFTKMKGVGYTNNSGAERVWDVADYVFPSQVSDLSCPQ